MGSQSDVIREALIGRVRAGRMLPGDPVDEQALKAEFGVSGTPVREALTQLEAVGLIERSPRAGARIFLPDVERLIGLIEVHAELEGMTAHFAARRINSAQARDLVRATEACEAFVADPENIPPTGYYQLNIDYHLALIAAMNNEDLGVYMNESANRIISYFRARHRLRGEPLRSAREHRLVTETVLAGDAEKARELMIRHVIVDGASILDVINKMNERF